MIDLIFDLIFIGAIVIALAPVLLVRLSALPGFEELARIFAGLEPALRVVAIEQMRALAKLKQR